MMNINNKQKEDQTSQYNLQINDIELMANKSLNQQLLSPTSTLDMSKSKLLDSRKQMTEQANVGILASPKTNIFNRKQMAINLNLLSPKSTMSQWTRRESSNNIKQNSQVQVQPQQTTAIDESIHEDTLQTDNQHINMDTFLTSRTSIKRNNIKQLPIYVQLRQYREQAKYENFIHEKKNNQKKKNVSLPQKDKLSTNYQSSLNTKQSQDKESCNQSYIKNNKTLKGFALQDQYNETIMSTLQSGETKRQKNIYDEKNNLNKVNMFEYNNEQIDRKLLMIIKLLDTKNKTLKFLRKCNLSQAVDYMLDVQKLAIEFEDIQLFLESIGIIGETYLMFGEYKNCINSFNTLRQLSDIFKSDKHKIQALRNLSVICKQLGRYDYTVRFLKRALQYAWKSSNIDSELEIFDDLGIAFFLKVELEKAKYFHFRATKGIIEPQDSVERKISQTNLEMYNQKLQNDTKSIDNFLFAKVPTIPFSFINISEDQQVPKHIKNQFMLKNQMFACKMINKLETDMNELYQLRQIFQSYEFEDEIQTPRGTAIKSENRLQFEMNQGFKQQSLHRKTVSETEETKGFQPQFFFPNKWKDYRNEKSTFYLQEELKKKPLNDQIQLRIKQQKGEDYKHQAVCDLQTVKKNLFNKDTLNNRVELGHLTTNRNLENFSNSSNVLFSKPNLFFDKIIYESYKKSVIQRS